MVECMQAVLNDNLVEFFHSIGKSKHHIKQFEPQSESSSSEEDVLAIMHNSDNNDNNENNQFNRFQGTKKF